MAGLTTTQTFSDGDTVTAAKLNNIISNASIDADAVTEAKILNANVTLAKMATLSVDTGQLVDDAVQNSKLNDMAARTVKVNATDASANPTDVAMSNGVDVAENKLLVGTTDSINAVKFDTDLELDATDSAAADIRVADTLISGKSTVTVVPANDTVLVYDADGSGNKLGKATVTAMMQSLPAEITTSGVVRLATLVRSVAPNASGIDDADVLTAKIAGPMIAKAWGKFSHDGLGTDQTFFSWDDSFNINEATCSAVLGTKVMTIPFTNALPSTKYILVGTCWGDVGYQLMPILVTPGTANFTIKFYKYSAPTTYWPKTEANFVIYGLTS
jgi:hypothetical protein